MVDRLIICGGRAGRTRSPHAFATDDAVAPVDPRPVAARPAVDAIAVSVPSDHAVGSRAALDRVATGPADETIGASPALQEVGAASTGEAVAPRSTDEQVIAAVPEECVRSG